MGKSHQSFLIKCRGNVAVSINFGSSPQVALPFTCHMVQERRGVERSMVLDHGQTMGKPWVFHMKTREMMSSMSLRWKNVVILVRFLFLCETFDGQ